MKPTITYIVLLFAIVLLPVPTASSATDHNAHIDRLIKDKKYLTAAQYISRKPKLMVQDRLFYKYVHILVYYYAYSFNFDVFMLRDLKKHENINDVRGKTGQYLVAGSGLEKRLFNRLRKSPNSPYINLAVGEYLSRGYTCRCLRPQYFVGKKGSDYPYFNLAYKKGVANGWSLFRLGLYNHQQGKLKTAIQFYRKALIIADEEPAVTYNLAVALFQNRQNIEAKRYAKKALGSYVNPELNSDTYDLYGSILFSEGNLGQAEIHLKKALELKPWHSHAFKTLLSLYRQQKAHKKYRALVHKYIAKDYSNTYLFNRYIDYLTQSGMNNDDVAVINQLASRSYADTKTKGAVFYNLGRAYRIRGDYQSARKYFKKSLAAMKRLKNPPKGAIKALNRALTATPQK